MAACARDETATLHIGCRCLYRLAMFNEADGDGVRAVAGAHGAEAICKAMALHVDAVRHEDAAELLEEACRALASLAFGGDAECDTVRHTDDLLTDWIPTGLADMAAVACCCLLISDTLTTNGALFYAGARGWRARPPSHVDADGVEPQAK